MFVLDVPGAREKSLSGVLGPVRGGLVVAALMEETLPCVDVETERCEDRVSRRTGRLTPTVVLDSIEVPLTGISALERGVGMASPTRVLVPVDEGLLEMPKETLFCEELKRFVERVERRTGG